MKIQLVLLIIGLMCISSVLYWLNRLLIKSDSPPSGKSRKKKNKKKTIDWMQRRNQARWAERDRAKNEIELSRLTTGYIQVMLLLVLCLVLVLIYL